MLYMLISIHTLIRKRASELDIDAANRGNLRAIEELCDRLDLPAKYWPKFVKNEIWKQLKYKYPWDFPKPGAPIEERSLARHKGLMKDLLFEYSQEPEIIRMRSDLSNFDIPTQSALLHRIDLLQKEIDTSIPDDSKRHLVQEKLLEEKPDTELINDAPVLLKEVGLRKYAIREGWHRTIQLILAAKKRGLKEFKIKAYVGRQGNAFQLLDYYLVQFGKFLRNEPIVKNPHNRFDKAPYREVVRDLNTERKRLLTPEK